MRATAYVLSMLAAEGLDHVFFVPGALVAPFLPELADGRGVRPIVAAHAAGAACMADGYARASGRFGACIVSCDPGCAELAAGIAAAGADASPVLCLTGRAVGPADDSEDFSSSPCGEELLRPLTAASFDVGCGRQLESRLRAGLTAMLAGSQAPAHVRLPLDVQEADVEGTWRPLDESCSRPRFVDGGAVERLWRVLVPEGGGAAPWRVAILAGAGVGQSGASEALAAFAEQFEIPVATTLRGKGVFPEDHRLSLGVFGAAGHRHAAQALLRGQVEVLIVLGSGLSHAADLFGDPGQPAGRVLVHVDADPAAIGRRYPVDVPIVGDCRAALAHMMEGGSARIMRLRAGNESRAAWMRFIRESGPALAEVGGASAEASLLHPAQVATWLRRALPRDGAVVVDRGSHRAFFTHFFQAYGPRTYFTAVGAAPRGWAIGAAVGVKAALGGRAVACVTGDGGMLARGADVATAARHGLSVAYVVVNNGAFGEVWPGARAAGPRAGALAELPEYDFAAFGRALGARGVRVECADALPAALAEAFGGEGPCVVDVRCAREYAVPGA